MRILLTAFEPYDRWTSNSSWLSLAEFIHTRPFGSNLVTRRYPVNLDLLCEKLAKDLQRGFDAVVHLGQAPGSEQIRLESIALNVGGRNGDLDGELECLVESAPIAYRSEMPLGRWVEKLRQAHVPASVSYHAGTYLCNAVMFLTHHWYATRGENVPVAFVHLPLASEQRLNDDEGIASLPLSTLVRALEIIIDDIEQAGTQSRELA